jgi:hypothetical protein
VENVATRQRVTMKPAARVPKLNLFSVLAWALILGLIALVAGALAVGAGGLLTYLYPAATLVVGAVLYWHRPALYLGFTWWLWFLTPEVRRLVDYQQGWNPVNPVMLAPFLVTWLASFALLYHLPKLQLKRYFPFGLIVLGLSYAYGVGAYWQGTLTATYDLLNWAVPVVFAFYLAVHWRAYPDYRRVVQRTFVWGVLIIGLYGVLQYYQPPAWDTYWMENAPIDSIGSPEPFEVRVFSTLNAPGVLAVVMMAGLLLTLSGGGLLRWPAAVPGYACFLLSLVRSAWGGWIVGLLFMIAQGGRFRMRLGATVLVMGLIAWPLLSVGPVAQTIDTRLQTLTEVEQDESFRQRQNFYAEFAPVALTNFVGEGLGSTGLATKLGTTGGTLGEFAVFDSGLMNIPFVLGWPGSLLYLAGSVWLLIRALRSGGARSDLFVLVSRGIVVAMLTQLLFFNSLVGTAGIVFWSFLGLTLAASTHVSAQGTKQPDRKGWKKSNEEEVAWR